jgi:hypothetical protein
VLINGRLEPDTIELRRGASHRLRLINITTGRPGLRLELMQDTTRVNWRPVAKDGADIPQAERTLRPAAQRLSIGETTDVEFFATRPGDFQLRATTATGVQLAGIVLRVR